MFFVTSSKYDGDLDGLDGADAICQAHADTGKVPQGEYKALLHSSTMEANSRINSNWVPHYGYSNIDNNEQFSQLSSSGYLITGMDGAFNQGPIRDEDGLSLTGELGKQAWIGGGGSCNDFTSNSNALGRLPLVP